MKQTNLNKLTRISGHYNHIERKLLIFFFIFAVTNAKLNFLSFFLYNNSSSNNNNNNNNLKLKK